MNRVAVTSLEPATTAALRARGHTYFEVGATRVARPSGYHHQSREIVIGAGRARFIQCADAIMTWQVQVRAGIAVATSDDSVVEGTVARLGIGIGPLRIHSPARVVYVLDEPRHAGFAYGTLPGHPEVGEEVFEVEHRPDDSVVSGVAAFSRPGSPLTTAAGPLGPLRESSQSGTCEGCVAAAVLTPPRGVRCRPRGHPSAPRHGRERRSTAPAADARSSSSRSAVWAIRLCRGRSRGSQW